MTPTPLPLRADAQRNREQLIDAAARTFLTGGPDVPMEEIAREAGVGVGTLYRRFADRESLMVASTRPVAKAVIARPWIGRPASCSGTSGHLRTLKPAAG